METDAPRPAGVAVVPAVQPRVVDLRLIGPAAGVWGGCLLGRACPPAAAGVLVAGILGVAAVVAGVWRVAAGAVAAVATMTAAGTGIAALHAHARTTGPFHAMAARQASARLELVVTADPVVRPAPGPVRARDLVLVRGTVVRADDAQRSYRLSAPVLVLSRPDGWTGLLPSTRVRVVGRLSLPQPGDDLAAVVNVRGPPTALARADGVQRVAGRLRTGLRDAAAGLPTSERGLVPALVDGDVSALPPQVVADFRTSGLTHLTAVSGSNCAILLGAVLVLVRHTRLRRPARAGCLLLAVGIFVLVARPSPSVLRAAVMALVTVLALAVGRPRAAVPALAAAVAVLLLADPELATSVGFALSVVATAGLLLLAPGWTARMARRMPGRLAEGLSVAAAAQVSCTPVLAASFGSVGLVAVPANLLAVPAVPPATLLGVVITVLAQVWMPAARALAWLPAGCCWWLVTVARTAARMPGAAIPWRTGLTGAVMATGAALLVVAAVRRRPGRRLLAAVVCGVLVARVGTGPLLGIRWPPAGWRLLMCDVGQGDALVLRTGTADPVLIDTGPDPALLSTCLLDAGVRRLDRVLLTHLHADHVDGLPAVLGHVAVGQVEIGPLLEPAGNWHVLQREFTAARVPVRSVTIGAVERIGDLSWTVLAPRTVLHGTDSDPNNDSLVLAVRAPGMTLLLTGDVETEAEQELLRHPETLHADVLKVPHHGSDRQDPRFLGAVAPRVALTSVGAGNPYGHPAPLTLRRLRESGIRAFRTDVDGALAVGRGQDGRLTVSRHGARTPSLTAIGALPPARPVQVAR